MDTRSRHLRIFTTEEAIAIREPIVANYVIPRASFTSEDFLRTATEAVVRKYTDSEKPAEFNCSNGLVQDFKSRNSFSSRRANRAMIEDAWVNEMRELMATAPNLERVVNCDETCWRV